MAAVWLCAIPNIAAAAVTHCAFTQECLIADDCYETNFSASLESQGKDTFTNADQSVEVAATMGRLVSDAETLPGLLAFHKDHPDKLPSLFVSLPGQAGHWMTIQEDGATFYTVHLAKAELAITYRGTCKMKAE
ncbi:hypothetical protein [Algirhabdus cladophorae]|uniref:hypothetical protein n=1 Tax=Algirhabdus cladophorae TaxID=3377108 RepID=UPI003B84B515